MPLSSSGWLFQVSRCGIKQCPRMASLFHTAEYFTVPLRHSVLRLFLCPIACMDHGLLIPLAIHSTWVVSAFCCFQRRWEEHNCRPLQILDLSSSGDCTQDRILCWGSLEVFRHYHFVFQNNCTFTGPSKTQVLFPHIFPKFFTVDIFHKRQSKYQPKSPSVGEWVKKMKPRSALTLKETLSLGQPEGACRPLCSLINQTQKDGATITSHEESGKGDLLEAE